MDIWLSANYARYACGRVDAMAFDRAAKLRREHHPCRVGNGILPKVVSSGFACCAVAVDECFCRRVSVDGFLFDGWKRSGFSATSNHVVRLPRRSGSVVTNPGCAANSAPMFSIMTERLAVDLGPLIWGHCLDGAWIGGDPGRGVGLG